MERSLDEQKDPIQVLEGTQSQPEERCDSSQESLSPRPDRRIEQACPYSDLNNPNAPEFDRNVVDMYRQTLDIERCFQGTGDILPTPSIVEEHETVDQTGGSVLIRVRIGGERFACKKCWAPTRERRRMYENEVTVLKTLREAAHWHVILLLCHYNPHENESCLVLSPLAQCNLKQYLQHPLTEGRRRIVSKWFGCLAKALSILHSQKIKHKDLKPANILIHGENVLIADMGISQPWVDRSTTTGESPGSKMYMAPEILKIDPRNRRQDIWSLVCCYIEMFSWLTERALRFREPRTFYHNYTEVTESLKSFRPSVQDVDDGKVLDFILRSFRINPKQRPLTPEIVDFFRSIGHGDKYIGECCASSSVSGTTALSPQVAPVAVSSNVPLQSLKSLVNFVESARRGVKGALTSPVVDSSFNKLLREVNGGRLRSIRSVEKKFLLYIAQRECQSARDYLGVCKAFVKVLTDVIEGCRDSSHASDGYEACLYDESLGEQEQPYTTAYFAIMIDVILSRYRTSHWVAEDGP